MLVKVATGNKLLSDAMLTQVYVVMWPHYGNNELRHEATYTWEMLPSTRWVETSIFKYCFVFPRIRALQSKSGIYV